MLLVTYRVAFWSALLFALTMAWVPHPPSVAEIGDKFQHMAAFGTLSLLACAAYPKADLLRMGERLSFVGAMVEVVQSIPALRRDCDVMDWVADTAIIAAVVAVVALIRSQRKLSSASAIS
jgi:hypothetical protein